MAVRFVDVDECPDLAKEAGVLVLPTFVVLDPRGRVLRTKAGTDVTVLEGVIPPP